MAYFALVTKLHNYRKDENSDRLWLADCYGEGVIVGPDMNEDELVLYLPTDGRLARWFGNNFSLFRKNEDGTTQGGYVEDNGHIKAVKLRGNQSSGIVMRLSAIYEKYGDQHWREDMEVTQINGKTFVEKYIPKTKHVAQEGGGRKHKQRGNPRIKYPEFDMHIDTAQLAYNLNQFREGDKINLSVKMHGTSQRSMNTYGLVPNTGIKGFFRRLFHMGEKKVENQFVLGTRRCVVYENSTGFYGKDDFRRQHHEAMKPFIKPGMEVFYEVVGWYGPNETDTIMAIGDNTKLKDKEFQKKFGKRTVFSYGCEVGESKPYVYRITENNGAYEYTPGEIMAWVANCQANGAKVYAVPYFEDFEFTTTDDLMERVNRELEDLIDPIGGHLKEGVVVRILNRRTFTAYKAKTYEFKVLEGIIKDTEDSPDMEEAQEV